MVDINKLEGELKTGKIIGEGMRAVLLTPVCRASFPALVEEELYMGKPTGKHAITPLFETDPSKPAAVDLSAALIPFIQKTLAAYGIKPSVVDGNILAGTQTLIHKGEKISQEGKPYDGYSLSTVYIKANHKIRSTNDPVPCYDAAGNPLDPSKIYGGCYIRIKLGLFKPKNFPNLSITLKSVQFIADGDRFAGDGVAAMDAIPGADAVVDTPDDGDLSKFV